MNKVKKKWKAKDLMRFFLQLKDTGIKASFDHELQGRVRRLSHLKPDTTDKGNPSIRTICVIEDGKQGFYDGNFEFLLVARTFNGQRKTL